jgi:hypothetical protein
MIRVVHPGSRIRMLTFSHPGSRIQGSKRHPIPNPGSGSATLLKCERKLDDWENDFAHLGQIWDSHQRELLNGPAGLLKRKTILKTLNILNK